MVNVCVLRGLGINADEELVTAFGLVGARTHSVHVTDLTHNPGMLDNIQILALPGGFSFGDHLGSGHVLAGLLSEQLGDHLKSFIDSGRLMIGICNGFQVLVKTGVLPDTEGDRAPQASLIHNDSGRFEDRWVRVDCPADSRCVWTKGLSSMELPVRHGEGKFVTRDEQVTRRLAKNGQIAMTYGRADKRADLAVSYPENPNGSELNTAGVCDPTGRIFGLMPHPEAFLMRENHPEWARREKDLPLGLEIFRNGVAFAEKEL